MEELGFENVEFDDILHQKSSPFCKVNPNGYKGSKGDKRGYIIGPTFTPSDNDEDENTIENFEAFIPKVYIKDKVLGNLKEEYRMVLLRFEKISFVIFIKEDKYKFSEEVYKNMYEKVEEKCKNMDKKVDPIVEYNDENPLEPEDKVKFFYYNKMNLAIKYTPALSKKVLTNELKHFLNIIKTKFEDNPSMVEYQLSSTSYWILGKQALSRLLVIVLPINLSQADAENRANEIREIYFSTFII